MCIVLAHVGDKAWLESRINWIIPLLGKARGKAGKQQGQNRRWNLQSGSTFVEHMIYRAIVVLCTPGKSPGATLCLAQAQRQEQRHDQCQNERRLAPAYSAITYIMKLHPNRMIVSHVLD